MGGPNIVEGIHKFDRAFTALVRDDDYHLEKSIRMDNMAWSLEDFDKLCSGRYNAGSLTIDYKGRLDIVNNHVDVLSILNGKTVDASDSFAIRRAFANALEENGLNEQQMSEVRARLGLRKDNNTWKTGACFTPLKRQEVREIMDKYIDDLNKGRPEERRFVTQSQMHWYWNLSEDQSNEVKGTRDAINNQTKQDVKIPFDADLLHTLDLLSKQDFTDRKIFTDEVLHDTALFYEDLEDHVEELANLTKEDLQIWRHENPGKTFYIPIGRDCFLSLDPKTNNVLLTARGSKVDSKMVTFSTGVKPGKMLNGIRAANERLHAEGAKRGLNLAGKEFVDGNVGKEMSKPMNIIIDDDDVNPSLFSSLPKKSIIDDDSSIKDCPKPKKKIIETNDVIKPSDVKPTSSWKYTEVPQKSDIRGTKMRFENAQKVADFLNPIKVGPKVTGTKVTKEGKYTIIEEREDEPKVTETRPDPIIPVAGADEDDDGEPFIPLLQPHERKV